jgi:hypothetical protein
VNVNALVLRFAMVCDAGRIDATHGGSAGGLGPRRF